MFAIAYAAALSISPEHTFGEQRIELKRQSVERKKNNRTENWIKVKKKKWKTPEEKKN